MGSMQFRKPCKDHCCVTTERTWCLTYIYCVLWVTLMCMYTGLSPWLVSTAWDQVTQTCTYNMLHSVSILSIDLHWIVSRSSGVGGCSSIPQLMTENGGLSEGEVIIITDVPPAVDVDLHSTGGVSGVCNSITYQANCSSVLSFKVTGEVVSFVKGGIIWCLDLYYLVTVMMPKVVTREATPLWRAFWTWKEILT